MAHDVFISHSSKDKIAADSTCAVLESHGIRCWVAPRDIVPSTDWTEAIMEALTGSRIMVLIFSENANQSPQIKREVNRAIDRGIPILPLRIENVMPTGAMEYSISTAHWLDAYTPPLEKHLEYLAQSIQGLLSKSPPKSSGNASSTAGPGAPPESRGVPMPGRKKAGIGVSAWVGVAVAILVVVGGAIYALSGKSTSSAPVGPSSQATDSTPSTPPPAPVAAAPSQSAPAASPLPSVADKTAVSTPAVQSLSAAPAPVASPTPAPAPAAAAPAPAAPAGDALEAFHPGDYVSSGMGGGEITVTGPFPTDDNRQTWVCTGKVTGTWTTGPVAGHPALVSLPKDAIIPKGWTYGLTTSGDILAVRQLANQLIIMEPREEHDQWDRVELVAEGSSQRIYEQRPGDAGP